MKHISRFLMIAIVVLTSGCFDSSPPAGVTGELVGCLTSDDDLYCVTKYADNGVSDTVDVLIGEIDYEVPARQTFSKFHLNVSYTDEEGDEVYRAILIESLRNPWERTIGYKGPGQFEGIFTRVYPGDTVAVAIVNLPTILIPHQGYIIANLTRPDVSFEIPEEVGDIDVLNLTAP